MKTIKVSIKKQGGGFSVYLDDANKGYGMTAREAHDFTTAAGLALEFAGVKLKSEKCPEFYEEFVNESEKKNDLPHAVYELINILPASTGEVAKAMHKVSALLM